MYESLFFGILIAVTSTEGLSLRIPFWRPSEDCNNSSRCRVKACHLYPCLLSTEVNYYLFPNNRSIKFEAWSHQQYAHFDKSSLFLKPCSFFRWHHHNPLLFCNCLTLNLVELPIEAWCDYYISPVSSVSVSIVTHLSADVGSAPSVTELIVKKATSVQPDIRKSGCVWASSCYPMRMSHCKNLLTSWLRFCRILNSDFCWSRSV